MPQHQEQEQEQPAEAPSARRFFTYWLPRRDDTPGILADFERRARAYFEVIATERSRPLVWVGTILDESLESRLSPLRLRPGGSELDGQLRRGDHVALHLPHSAMDTEDFIAVLVEWQVRNIVVHLALAEDFFPLADERGTMCLRLARELAEWAAQTRQDAAKEGWTRGQTGSTEQNKENGKGKR